MALGGFGSSLPFILVLNYFRPKHKAAARETVTILSLTRHFTMKTTFKITQGGFSLALLFPLVEILNVLIKSARPFKVPCEVLAWAGLLGLSWERPFHYRKFKGSN